MRAYACIRIQEAIFAIPTCVYLELNSVNDFNFLDVCSVSGLFTSELGCETIHEKHDFPITASITLLEYIIF